LEYEGHMSRSLVESPNSLSPHAKK
jgi:hypothetical protein